MLPRDQLSLAPVARTLPAAPVADPRQQAFQRALAGQLGQSMRADVVARLNDGSFVVRLRDMPDLPARMPLPPGTQVGSQMALTLVALQPRATFQLNAAQNGQGASASAPVFAEAGPPLPEGADPQAAPLAYIDGARAAALARNAALLAPARGMAQLGGAPGQDGAGASLSPAGKAIGDVLAAALKADRPATAAIGRTPLLAGPSADPGALAAALRQGLEKSGLFYESHVAEWAGGGRSLADLAAEPQAQGRMPSALAPDAAQFINLQLGAHEQGRVAWQGQLWPGQELRWEIGRDAEPPVDEDGRAARDDDAGGAPWQSRLRLRFGSLGEVEARVVLAGDRVHVRLDAGLDAGARLKAAAARLAAALDAAGTPLAALAVHAPQAAPSAAPQAADGIE